MHKPPARQLKTSRLISLHKVSLGDGSPHCVPHSDVIVWESPSGIRWPYVKTLAVTGSRLVTSVSLPEDDADGPGEHALRVLSWDWETGDLVRRLRLRSHPSHIVSTGS